MKKGSFIACIILVMLTEITSCNYESQKKNMDRSSEIAMIEKVIHNNIGWAKNKDLKLLYSTIAQDTMYLEVQPGDKVVKGIAEFKKAESFWMSPNFKAVRYEIRNLTINLSASGDAAWWYCVLDDINEWKGQPANWENTRWTGVMEKREGKWVIVQMHFSFAQK